MKKCPYCAEEIQEAAIVCRYCGRDVAPESAPAATPAATPPATPAATPPPAHIPPASPPPGPPSPVAPVAPVASADAAPPPKKRTFGCWTLGCGGLALLFLVLFLIGLLVGDPAPSGPAPAAEKTILYAQQENVAVHSSPSAEADVVAQLDFGARVVGVSKEGEWTKLDGEASRWVETSLLGRQRPLTEEERQQKTNEILAELQKLPASEIERNKDLYGELVDLHPENSDYQAKLEHYRDKIREQENLAREERARQEGERQQRLALFGEPPKPSAWDGTYGEVKDYLRKVANDPDSIEIDSCTKVYHTDNGWLVGCDYRGRNAFGGMIRQSNWFIIVQGRVLEMHDASRYSP